VDIVEYIDKALRIIEGLDKVYMEIYRDEKLSRGRKLELYQLTTELRETLIAIRVLAERLCRNSET